MSTLLEAKKRENDGYENVNQLRVAGGVPGVLYGYKVENTPLSVSSREFYKVIREVGRNGVINLDLDGDKVDVILHDYQEDPIRREVVHLDFLAVDLDQEIEAAVFVEVTGEVANDGGVLQHVLHELNVLAKPNDFPENIEVSVDKLEIGDSVTVADIRKNVSATINHEDDETIVTVIAPQQEVEESTEDENAEPVLISEEKAENEQ